MSDKHDLGQVEERSADLFGEGDDLLSEELKELEGLSAEELAELDKMIGEEDLHAGLEAYRADEMDLGFSDVDDAELHAQLAEYLDDDDLSDIDFDAEPVDVDDEWRESELEKLIIGDRGQHSGSGKFIAISIFILLIGFIGWFTFAPSGDAIEARIASLPTLPELEPAPPEPPPPPPPPPKPYRDLFEVQTGFDGERYIVYTIHPDDDLQTIGEKLHDVTQAPRPVTYLAVEDAYWRKYFSYEEQNAEIVTPEEVAEHVGETIQIPVPIPEFPDFDLAALVDEYNQP